MSTVRLAALSMIVLSMGCSSEDPAGNDPESCTPTATRVCMVNSLFDPPAITIARGASVDWVNADALPHTTTSSPGNPAACGNWDEALDARTANSVSTARVLFSTTTPVTCAYYCKLHATPTSGTMRGSIIVQ
jgi:plastocyanin